MNDSERIKELQERVADLERRCANKTKLIHQLSEALAKAGKKNADRIAEDILNPDKFRNPKP